MTRRMSDEHAQRVSAMAEYLGVAAYGLTAWDSATEAFTTEPGRRSIVALTELMRVAAELKLELETAVADEDKSQASLLDSVFAEGGERP